jgi:non-ribosomal peptide synthetase component F
VQKVLHTTPTTLKYLLTSVFVDDYFKTLRYILIAGEELPPGLVSSWYNNYTAGIQLINLYGPTETTLAKVFARIPSDFSGEHVPVGKAIDGSVIHIINSKYICWEETTTS